MYCRVQEKKGNLETRVEIDILFIIDTVKYKFVLGKRNTGGEG